MKNVFKELRSEVHLKVDRTFVAFFKAQIAADQAPVERLID